MKIFVVGKVKLYKPGEVAWELAGVFSNIVRAESACEDESYFVGPVELDVATPEKTTGWPGCYYPRAQK